MADQERKGGVSRRQVLATAILGGAAVALELATPKGVRAATTTELQRHIERLGEAGWTQWSPEVSITNTVPGSGVEHVDLAAGVFKSTLVPEMKAAFADPGGYLFHSDGYFNGDGSLNVEFIKAVKTSNGAIQEGTPDRVKRASGEENFHWDVPVNGWTRITLAQGVITTDNFAIRVSDPKTTKLVYLRGLYRPANQEVFGNTDFVVSEYDTTTGSIPGRSNLLVESLFSENETNVGFWSEGNATQVNANAARQDKNAGMGDRKTTTIYIDLNTIGAFVVDHSQPRGASKAEAQTIAREKSRYTLRKANFKV